MRDLRIITYSGTSYYTTLILEIERELARKEPWRSFWTEEDLSAFRSRFTWPFLKIVEDSGRNVLGYFVVADLNHYRKLPRIIVKPGENYEEVITKILGYVTSDMSLNGFFALDILAKEHDIPVINFLDGRGIISRSYIGIDKTEVSVCDSYILQHNLFSQFSQDQGKVITKLPRKYFFDVREKLNSSALVEWKVFCLYNEKIEDNSFDPSDIYFVTLSSVSKTRDAYNSIAQAFGISRAMDEVKVKPRSSLVLPSSWIVGKEEFLEKDLSKQFIPLGKTCRYKDFENDSWWSRGRQ